MMLERGLLELSHIDVRLISQALVKVKESTLVHLLNRIVVDIVELAFLSVEKVFCCYQITILLVSEVVSVLAISPSDAFLLRLSLSDCWNQGGSIYNVLEVSSSLLLLIFDIW